MICTEIHRTAGKKIDRVSRMLSNADYVVEGDPLERIVGLEANLLANPLPSGSRATTLCADKPISPVAYASTMLPAFTVAFT